MPAWSVPGSQSVGRPRARWNRARMSWSATNMAWPRWSRPVTFGGGMGHVYAPRGCSASLGSKRPRASHHA